ncbi:MAG: hypothetical protein ACRC41_13300, partial [Sarcina sp.]
MSSTTVTYQTPDGTVVPGGTTTPIVVPGGTPQTVTITPPPGYKLVPKNPVSDNGTNVTPNKDGKIDVNTGTPEQGKDNHIIVIVQKIVQNTVKVQVQNPDGTVVPITSDNAGNYEGGSNLTPQTSIDGVDGASAVTKDGTPLTTPVAPKGYHIVKVVNELGSTATTETDNYKVPGTLGKENNSTTYTIAPNSATLDVSVNLVNSKNEVVSQLEKPTTTIPNTKGYYNEKIGTNGEPSQTVQEGIASGKYTVTSVTVNGKTMSLNDYKTEVADGTLNAANGENHVVYNVTENEGKVEVTLQIQGPDGTIQKVLISNKQVQDAPVGTPIAGANYSDISNMVPAGYHLIKTTVDNKPLLENNKPGTTIGGDVVPGITHVVYTIAKDSMSSTTVTYQTPDGTVVPGGTTTPIVVPGGTPQTVTITPPPGYKLVP